MVGEGEGAPEVAEALVVGVAPGSRGDLIDHEPGSAGDRHD